MHRSSVLLLAGAVTLAFAAPADVATTLGRLAAAKGRYFGS
ncbi:hypothetical protein [Nonomuraea sp. CA-141351]